MNKKLKKLFKNPKAYFYDYFRKQVRAHPNGPVSLAVKMAFANAKTDLGYGNEIRKYLRQGKLEQAENICIEGIGVVPKAISPIVLFADVSMRKGDFAEALNRWQKVIEKFPHKPDGYAGEARAYAALGDYEHVEQLCRNSIKNMPQELWPYIELAEISMHQGNFGEAIERWGAVRAKFPDKVPGYVRASVACCSLERFAEAEELCRECMKVAPGDIRAYAEYAEVSLRQRDFDVALKRCQTVRERFPKRAVGYVRAAWAYSEIKEYPKAEDLCRKSMEIAPKDIRSFAEYAEISMRKGDFKEASNRWEIVCDKFPTKVDGYLGGGKAYQQLNELEKAERKCRQGLEALKHNPANCRAVNYLLISITLKQKGKIKNCIKLISNIEHTLPATISDRRYYAVLEQVLLVILQNKEEDLNKFLDFILIRLLNEPISSVIGNITLGKAFFKLSRLDKDIFKKLKGYIELSIQKNHINNPLSVLVSSSSFDKDRLNAQLEIMQSSCYHTTQLCMFQPSNFIMLKNACDLLIDGGEWKSYNPKKLFDFTRVIVYTDQNKADKFISKINDINKGKIISLSDPIGLLCFRHKKRHELINSISRHLITDKTKLNIAVCISGQLRGYKGNLESLVNALGLRRHNYRVFVHTWNNIGRRFPIAIHAPRVFTGELLKAYIKLFINTPNLQDYIKTHYPSLYRLITNSSLATYEDLQTEYKTADIVIEKEEDEPFSSFSNQEKMHYKIYAAHKLAVDSGESFDLIIRIRPDLKRESENKPDLVDIYNKSILNASIFTVGSIFPRTFNNDYGIDDKFAIGIPDTMNIYANTYWDFQNHTKSHTYSCTKEFIGHATLEQSLFFNGVHVNKIEQGIFGPLKNPEIIPTEEVYKALCMDVEKREIKSEDKQLLGACKKDLKLL